MDRTSFTIAPLTPDDADWVRALVTEWMAGDFVVSRGQVQYPHRLPGFVAVAPDGRRIGLANYALTADECELVTLSSQVPGIGVGTALIQAVESVARQAGCRRLWLVTTNDNLDALGFYQKRGFTLVAVHRNALEATRRLKPSLPLIGEHGIPLRDEIELERALLP